MSNQKTLNRLDYIQVGLTSKNCLKVLNNDKKSSFDVAIGDHSGSLYYLSIKQKTSQCSTIFKTLSGPNAKINCIEGLISSQVNGSVSSTKLLIASGPSTIKGFNKKGKQFFTLELNNLTEPIKLFKINWPNEIFVVGQYIYNSYLLNTESINTNSNTNQQFNLNNSSYNSVVKSRHYYVCPAKINDFLLFKDKLNRKIVPVLACQDRLLRVLKDSDCNFEVEVCGIPSVIRLIPSHFQQQNEQLSSEKNTSQQQSNEEYLLYGTMDGKIAMIEFCFVDKNQLEPLHHWEVPLNAIKQPISCLHFHESDPEFYVGRSDGTIEVWRLSESINEDNYQKVDLTIVPSLVNSYNCGESLTNILPVMIGERSDLLLLCSTFTGILFGLVQNNLAAQQQLNPNYLIISQENAERIQKLKEECEKLEEQLNLERERYDKQTSQSDESMNVIEENNNLSILPFFAINDSFILHNDASYLLLLEVEVALDVVFLHCDSLLDLIDCERNSAVISFNEPLMTENEPKLNNRQHRQLVTFRCQSNTTRLEIRLRPVEGQQGTLTVYVLSKITPKCCQTRSYFIQPLSLHKRQYSNVRVEHSNSLSITGNFGLNDAHTWLQMCLPEVPKKVTLTISDVESEVFYYVSTMSKSVLTCNCGKNVINLSSDNVSTISILKDFITREATRQSIQIEIKVDIAVQSLEIMLKRLYPKIQSLILEKQQYEIRDAISDLQTSDAEIVGQLLKDLNFSLPQVDESSKHDFSIELDRLYGIITDLFIDYFKLKGNSILTLVSIAKEKLPSMIVLIESIILETYETFDEKQQSSIKTESLTLESKISSETSSISDDEKIQIDSQTMKNDSTTNMKNDSNFTSKQNTNVKQFVDKLFQFWNI